MQSFSTRIATTSSKAHRFSGSQPNLSWPPNAKSDSPRQPCTCTGPPAETKNSKASRAPRPHAATGDTLAGTPTCHTQVYIQTGPYVIHAPRRHHVQSPLLQMEAWSPCRVISFRSRTSYRRATRSRRAVERPGAIRSRSNGCVAPEPDKASPQQRKTPIPIPIPPPHPPWAVARVAVAAAAGRQRPPGGERSPARAPRPPPRSNRPDLGPSGPPPPWRGDCRCGQRCSSPSSSPALVPPSLHPRPTMSARCLLSWNPFLVLETRARRWILATRSASWR